jgi:thiol:disulfide interchange protein
MKFVVVLLAIAACSKSEPSKQPLAGELTEAPIRDVAWHAVDVHAPLTVSLESFVRAAKAVGLKPFAYLHADWCEPCRAIEKTHVADARMASAFQGTAIATIDIDEMPGETLLALGFDTNTIPVFFRLDDAGKPTGAKIDGSAWADNVPATMAPPLAAFFAK